MPSDIILHLDTNRYIAPTERDIRAAKRYILRRSEAASSLQELIEELLTDAAVKIVEIAYKYGIPGDSFTIDASEEQKKEIDAVMDELEQEILDMLEELIINGLYNEDDNGKSMAIIPLSAERKAALLAFMLSLGHRNNNLRTTLYSYEWRFLYDMEAAIAALRSAGISMTDAVASIRSHIGAIYTIPQLIAAIRHPQDFMAQFIRTSGVPYNPDGSPNTQGVPREGYNAILNTIHIVLDMVWGRNQLLDFMEQGAVGYYQLRGSDYPCDICNDEVGFHFGLIDEDPLPHPHCMCYRIPIFPSTN